MAFMTPNNSNHIGRAFAPSSPLFMQRFDGPSNPYGENGPKKKKSSTMSGGEDEW